jgi:hypothetical protein
MDAIDRNDVGLGAQRHPSVGRRHSEARNGDGTNDANYNNFFGNLDERTAAKAHRKTACDVCAHLPLPLLRRLGGSARMAPLHNG